MVWNNNIKVILKHFKYPSLLVYSNLNHSSSWVGVVMGHDACPQPFGDPFRLSLSKKFYSILVGLLDLPNKKSRPFATSILFVSSM